MNELQQVRDTIKLVHVQLGNLLYFLDDVLGSQDTELEEIKKAPTLAQNVEALNKGGVSENSD